MTGALPRQQPTALASWFQLLRWNKPSGRLILLIPAGWSLWLTPNAPFTVVGAVDCGRRPDGERRRLRTGDLWDRRLDREVERTKGRPLARGGLSVPVAVASLLLSWC